LAQEAGRTRQAISFKKGCYLGQEPIARIDALGHVNQQLVGLRLRGAAAPAPGSDVVDAVDQQRVIGRVTSSILSALSGQPICLACLKRQYTAPGTPVRVRFNEGWLEGIVFA
jgi:folate-binding Fe-S cluster repair protein YgfZ